MTYTYTITNTLIGDPNITGIGPVSVSSNLGSVSVNNPLNDYIGPGVSITGTSTHAITQSDLDQGSVINTSTASVNTIWNALNVQVPGTFVSNQVIVSVEAIQSPLLGLSAHFSVSSYDQIEPIQVTFIVTNLGNVR